MPVGQGAGGDDRGGVGFRRDGPCAEAAGKAPDPPVAVLVLRRHLIGQLVDWVSVVRVMRCLLLLGIY